jgi:uncharacterized damage-inducible protein DinB
MKATTVLTGAYDHIRDMVHHAIEGLTAEQLTARLDDEANSIAWLVWHLTRVQDDHVADVAGTEQAWTEGGWHKRFGLPFPAADTGYGHSPDDVAAVRVDSPDLLLGYHDAVHGRTIRYLASITGDDLDRIVDTSWDPPVTLGVRLGSVIGDDLMHVGQAALVRGILGRR